MRLASFSYLTFSTGRLFQAAACPLSVPRLPSSGIPSIAFVPLPLPPSGEPATPFDGL